MLWGTIFSLIQIAFIDFIKEFTWYNTWTSLIVCMWVSSVVSRKSEHPYNFCFFRILCLHSYCSVIVDCVFLRCCRDTVPVWLNANTPQYLLQNYFAFNLLETTTMIIFSPILGFLLCLSYSQILAGIVKFCMYIVWSEKLCSLMFVLSMRFLNFRYLILAATVWLLFVVDIGNVDVDDVNNIVLCC